MLRRTQRTAGLFVLAMLALVPACDPPNADTFRRFGGATPDPTGVLEGTILYVGPAPTCSYYEAPDSAGNPVPAAVTGRVVLLLFEFDNPPPPSGSATTAVTLLVIPGRELFSLAEYAPLCVAKSPPRRVARSRCRE